MKKYSGFGCIGAVGRQAAVHYGQTGTHGAGVRCLPLLSSPEHTASFQPHRLQKAP